LGAVERDAEESEVQHFFDFLADLLAVALRMEFGVDVGAGGPFPEKLFEVGVGVFFHEGEAFLFEEDAFGMEAAAAESDDGFAEFIKLAESGFRVGIGGGEGMGESGEADGDPIGEALGHGGGQGIGERGVFGVFGSEFESGAADLPVPEAALFPVREVDSVDGPVLKLGGHEGLDLRQGVEPFQQ
jgi:hypothetical protein